jgi:tetratricopeptide (TPR) repeat protein
MHWPLIIAILLGCVGLSTELESAEEVMALRMIIVQDKHEAQQIHQQLLQGASFSALAGTKSIGPERRAWGYSGIVRLADVQSDLQAVLRKLQPGQISKVLELGHHFAIVKVISPKIEQHYAAADRALSEGKAEQAVQELQAALRLEPDNVQTHIKLGMLYDSRRNYADAISYLEKAQSYAPDSAQIAIMRGAVYSRAAFASQDQTYGQKALQAYEDVLKLDERFAPAVHFGQGKVYLLVLHQPEKALVYLEKAVAMTPDVPQVYGLLIQACYDTQRYQKAWQYLRMAQSLGIEFPKLRDALHKADKAKQR